MSKKSHFGVLAAGTIIGAGASVLFINKVSSRTKDFFKEKANYISNKVKKMDSKDVKDKFDTKMNELEQEIKNFDTEKVLEIAKRKANEIKIKSKELVALARKKGDIALEKTACEIKQKAINVTKLVLEKLEEE